MSHDPNQGKCDCCHEYPATVQILDIEDWTIAGGAKICPVCAPMVMAQFSLKALELPATSDAISAAKLLEASETDMIQSGMKSLTGGVEGLKQLGDRVAARVICKTCGSSLRDFQKTGRLGCPGCYEAFGQTLEPALERIHGNSRTTHIGRRPGQPQADLKVALQYRLKRLERELATAVEGENYERAAQIRDEIQAIDANLREPNAPS